MDSLLAPNATQLEHDIEETTARLSLVDVTPTSDIWNPDTCPAHLLPWLAWAEKVDEWSSQWSKSVQREVIKAQRLVRRKRGTKAAVVASVQALTGSAAIKEWFEYSPQKTPHTFDITITGGDGYIDAELQDSMIRAIDRSKPVRSHYTLGIGINSASSLNFAGVAMVATYKRMEFTD